MKCPKCGVGDAAPVCTKDGRIRWAPCRECFGIAEEDAKWTQRIIDRSFIDFVGHLVEAKEGEERPTVVVTEDDVT